MHYYPAETVLARGGTAAQFIGIVVRGRLAAQRATMSGNLYVAEQYLPEQMFGDNAEALLPQALAQVRAQIYGKHPAIVPDGKL